VNTGLIFKYNQLQIFKKMQQLRNVQYLVLKDSRVQYYVKSERSHREGVWGGVGKALILDLDTSGGEWSA
jgi:hypothetical protein